MTIARALASLAWTATSVLVGILLGRAVRLVQDDDGAPLDRRDWLLVEDILEAADL